MAFHHSKLGIHLRLDNNLEWPTQNAISGKRPCLADNGFSGAVINVSGPLSGIRQLAVEFEFLLVGAPSLKKGRLGVSLLDYTDPSRPIVKLYDVIEVTDNVCFSIRHFGPFEQGTWDYQGWKSSQGYEGGYRASWTLDPAKTYLLGIDTLGADTKEENRSFWHWAGAKRYQLDIASVQNRPESSAIFLLEAGFMANVIIKRMETA